MIVRLNYHRRHVADCTGKHPEKTYSAEYEERKKGWKKCLCPITASGSLGRVAKRMATKEIEWEKAAAAMAPFIAANSWNIPGPPDGNLPVGNRGEAMEAVRPSVGLSSEDVPKRPAGKRCPIKEAIRLFLDEHRQAQSSPNTQRTYRYTLGIETADTPLGPTSMQAYSDQLGLVYIHEWEEPGLVRQYRALWGVSPLTATKKLGHLKAFFEFALENGWVTHNPARIKNRRNKTDPSEFQQRQPYTDADLEWMFEACREYGATAVREWPKKQNGKQVMAATVSCEYARKWTGSDLADFIALSVYTGLRISDVATFHIDRLQENGQILVRTIKSQGNAKVCTWVPPWLVARIVARAQKFGPLIFGGHKTADVNHITHQWRRRLQALWKQRSAWTHKPLPHRFRHTFVRILLEEGYSVALVADLLGNTESMVRKHYKFWVPSLQEATAAKLRGAFSKTPRPDQERVNGKVRQIRSA